MGEAQDLIEAIEEYIEASGMVAHQLCYSDSYGVYGSDFMVCHACGGGGAPHIPLEHKNDCVIHLHNKAEERLREILQKAATGVKTDGR